MALDAYIHKFTHLRLDKSPARWTSLTSYQAPHKPLLLLAVLDQFAEGTVEANLIELTLDLGELFTLYWARVMPPNQRGNLALPFFHLQSDGFWHLLPRPGKESYMAAVRHIRAMNDLHDAIIGARLDEDLYALVQLQPSRDALRQVLIETYFAPEAQAALVDQSIVNTEAYQYSQELFRQAKEKLREATSVTELYRPAVRDQGFRRAVISAYDHTCAMCGLRVLTPDGHTAADAAHIVPWSQTHNDGLGNGVALCKLCHWGFDEGLLTASANYSVMISPQLSADYNVPAHLPGLKDKKFTLPKEQAFWPDLEALKWHRQEVYRTR